MLGKAVYIPPLLTPDQPPFKGGLYVYHNSSCTTDSVLPIKSAYVISFFGQNTVQPGSLSRPIAKERETTAR